MTVFCRRLVETCVRWIPAVQSVMAVFQIMIADDWPTHLEGTCMIAVSLCSRGTAVLANSWLIVVLACIWSTAVLVNSWVIVVLACSRSTAVLANSRVTVVLAYS